MRTKVFIATLVVALTMVGTLFAQSSRKQIDQFLADYEKVVVKTEEAAKKSDLNAILTLQTEAAAFAEKSQQFQDASAWTVADSDKYLKLTNRYTEAVSKLYGTTSGSTTTTTATMPDLSGYSF